MNSVPESLTVEVGPEISKRETEASEGEDRFVQRPAMREREEEASCLRRGEEKEDFSVELRVETERVCR